MVLKSKTARQDLHSFPTRRSSDLYQAAYFTAVTLSGITVTALIAICSAPLMIAARSEEHTSELQSHHDHVCRHLHEKKKFWGFSCFNQKQHLDFVDFKNLNERLSA